MALFFCLLDFTKWHHITLDCREMNAKLPRPELIYGHCAALWLAVMPIRQISML